MKRFSIIDVFSDQGEGSAETSDLAKAHKKLLHHYDELSTHPVNEARFQRTYMARHKASGEYRSVRIVPKKNFPSDDNGFWEDLKAYQELLHPNVLHLYETLESRKYYYFITDRVDNPNIYQAIPKLFPDPTKFDEVQVALLVRTILRALQYCHKQGFPHTELKYHNILMDPKRGTKGLYIVGFGEARLFRPGNAIYSDDSALRERSTLDDSSGSGSSSDEDDQSEQDHNTNTNRERRKSTAHKQMETNDWFAAPETRMGDMSVFEEPSDIWSLGIIAYQLLTRHHPFEDPHVRPKKFENQEWKDEHFRSHAFLKNVSATARDFLKQLLTYKDTDRPTATQALEHEWITSVDRVQGTERKEALQDCLANLQNFDAENKLEQAARLFIANNLLRDGSAKRSLDSVFRHLDKVLVDGVITREELKVALERTHGKDNSVKVEQLLQSTFDRVDVNKDGVIEYAEFMAAAADDSILFTRQNLKKAFDEFDKGKTGTITVDDLNALCSGETKILSRRHARRIMRQVDLNGDGKITFEEFCELMQKRS